MRRMRLFQPFLPSKNSVGLDVRSSQKRPRFVGENKDAWNSRPFTVNKPYGSLPKKWSKFDRPQYQATHKKLLQARHELFAHSDMNVRKALIVPPNIPLVFDEGNELKSQEISTQVNYKLFEPVFFKIVRETNLDLGRRIQAEIDKMIIDLYGNMQLPNEAFNLRVDEGL